MQRIKNKRKYENKLARDPKNLGIPNICFSLVREQGDKRNASYARQRIKHGFDDSETWSLTDTIANFVLPRLKRFIVIHNECVCHCKSWDKDMQNIVAMLELAVRDKGSRIYSQTELAQINTGLNAFKRQFMNLWW